MIWWASQPSRARSERRAIAGLQEQSEWLRDLSWRLTPEARLCADFDIVRLGETIPLTITYPNFFPDMPPQITPRDGARLSGHQWGAGGELCLEYRPDNWDPAVTGAMMIESAHRLLTGEQPAAGEYASVASAHRMTIGQDVRGTSNRLLVSADLAAAIAGLALHQPVEFEASEHLATGHWLAFARRLGVPDAPIWSGGETFPGLTTRKGFAVRLVAALSGKVLPTFDFFDAVVRGLERDDLISRLDSAAEEFTMLVECAGTISMMSLAPGSGKRHVFHYKSVALPEDAPRLPAEYGRLAKASVAIVGCGSVGSKVAASLARSGIGRFVLVDGDLVFPGNVVRNDLDWRSVGLNKPDAVSRRIKSILPSAKVTRRRLLLGGQESSASTETALEEIGATIGPNEALLSTQAIFAAMPPHRHPATRQTIDLELLNQVFKDNEPEYWAIQKRNLDQLFRERVSGRIERQEIKHLSVFALAPQPLLIELGRLIYDIVPTTVHQRHREPETWNWQRDRPPLEFRVSRPAEGATGPVALKIAISGVVNDDRILSVLGADAAIWSITIDDSGNDVVRQPEDLSAYRRVLRGLYGELQARYGEQTLLHLFPAMPASLAVETGRVWMPKVNLAMTIYDHVRDVGFVPTFTIGEQPRQGA